MADHPFANAGLGMFGADAAIAKQAGTPDGASDKMKKIIGAMTGGALEAIGLKDFLDKLGAPSDSGTPAVPNTAGGAVQSSPAYSVAPPAPISQQGINPMALPNQVPGGVGLNAQPAGAINPFQFQTTPAPQLTPDDEHKNQVKSAWS